MSIRQLAPDVAAKIAAGEVVERPASVVKELIENSIDAGATQIRVDLTNGGLQLIRVVDNGSGIPAEELPLALARHATSKVAQIDDLEHIRSLGFRGEALASIAAVAEVTLLSRYRGAGQGAQVSAADGLISAVSAAASPEGTTLTVRNLFNAVPARLKFLKGRNTEVSHCHHLLEQYALAYPEIRFNVFSDGRQIFATPGDGQLVSTLVEVYGLQIAEQMVPISSLDGDERDDDLERPIVSGYTSQPACYKSTRQHISFFVNRRWVLSRMLTSAVEEAYHSLLLTGRHPIAVINIALDPTLLDVNVHPAKTEIRFLKERRVYAAVQRAVRKGLLVEAAMPTWGDGNRAGKGKQDMSEEQIATSESDTPDFSRDNPWLTVTEEETGSKPPLLSRLWQSHVRQPTPTPNPRVPERGTPTMDEDVSTLVQQPTGDVTHPLTRVPPSMVGVPLAGTLDGTGTLGGAGTLDEGLVGMGGRRLPTLRVIGQLAQSYIVTEGADGMYLIDQHAAHERILLERMVAALQASTPISQILLTPLQLELAPTEVEAIEEQLASLERIGFTLEIGDVNMLAVRAVPNVLVKQMNARSMHELLGDLTAPEHAGEGHTETWEEHALANVACKAAIKANYFLTVSEMREMIEQLEHTNAPYSCCHGRPTMVHMSLPTLEHEFERR
ncbi:MAG: DNA mismatch repair endonuclease MutL [Ktedonobacteraceae bacterium]